MRNSTLKEHKQVKKQLLTPWNAILGDKSSLRSWYKDRVPEYLWLGCIVNKYGRREGLKKIYYIIEYIINNKIEMNDLRFSSLLELNDSGLYDYICLIIDKDLMDIFSCVCENNELYRKKFYNFKYTNNYRINQLKENIKGLMNHQSELSTDLRFVIVYFLSAHGKLHFMEGMETLDALKEYYYLDHSDEKMKLYRSLIRSTEITTEQIYERRSYPLYFWDIVGKVSDCDYFYIDYKERCSVNMEEYIQEAKKQLSLLVLEHSKEFDDTKFTVLTSIFNYFLKVMNEIDEGNLYFKISGRILMRTLMDCYAIAKFLVVEEKDNPNIYLDYIEDGLGHYKLINIKARDSKIEEYGHMLPIVLESLSNEPKSEEYLDVNLGYFNKKSIIERFKEIGEKELYDLLYDYDVQFSHGHWGAIRESATVSCSNPLHKGHFHSDINFEVECSSIKEDMLKISNKFVKLINSQYEDFKIEELEKYGS